MIQICLIAFIAPLGELEGTVQVAENAVRTFKRLRMVFLNDSETKKKSAYTVSLESYNGRSNDIFLAFDVLLVLLHNVQILIVLFLSSLNISKKHWMACRSASFLMDERERTNQKCKLKLIIIRFHKSDTFSK